jgi:hypothetical protein
MKVKVKVPSSLDDITVGQYQAIQKLLENENLKGKELDNEILKIVLGFDNIDAISVKDRNRLYVDVQKALQKEGEFKQTFVLNGIEFGLIPNFDKINDAEYTDLIRYSKNDEDLHRFLAVAYRPTKFKDRFKNYTIVNYEGTKYNAERLKELPMSIAKGVQVFFFNLSKDLSNYILTSTVQEQVKE